MATQPIEYSYPPPSRSRRGVEGGLTVYQCANCGRYGAHQFRPGKFRCFFCKATIEYVTTTPGRPVQANDQD